MYVNAYNVRTAQSLRYNLDGIVPGPNNSLSPVRRIDAGVPERLSKLEEGRGSATRLLISVMQ